VEKSFDSGKAVFLNSKNNYKDHDNFTAVIFQEDKNRFPTSPEDIYWGKTVDVSGRIKKYKGRAEIILHDNSQITINQ
jgi:DNA/RNA endonuclease YhcR with UshA esterase domain